MKDGTNFTTGSGKLGPYFVNPRGDALRYFNTICCFNKTNLH